ncbi:hypothetical protein GCM10009000_061800 [Halobacterium noricense]|uniref:Uncharacterized protein n=1 Tax=Haladaptatus pallidirubidus TaxID=1008152 RepID=A0AAV3UJA7_9EURY|nr:hypothetical protein [Haladaptatus pallidirubidus]
MESLAQTLPTLEEKQNQLADEIEEKRATLDAIDSNRIARLVEYFSDYVCYLVAALLPEDAAALDDEYECVTEI